MINDIEMLNRIFQSAEMGCHGVVDVRREIKSGKQVDRLLSEQLVRYGKLCNAAGNMLKSRGAELRHISPFARTMSRLAAKRDLMRDHSASHIAEMMIKGNTMGVNRLAESLRQYDKSDGNITLLAKKMMDTEEEHIRQLRAFL